jgi:hypothetical protein
MKGLASILVAETSRRKKGFIFTSFFSLELGRKKNWALHLYGG